MIKYINCISLMTLSLGVFSANTYAMDVSVLSLDKVIIGVTTLEDIYTLYGKNKENRKDTASIEVCYANSSQNIFTVFQSGAMGGFDRITGFKLMTRKPELFCVASNIDMRFMATGNGVQLDQSRDDFLRNFDISFIDNGRTLKYDEESRRKLTKSEMEMLNVIPSSKVQSWFDVFTSISARFVNGRLTYYEVSKVESY